MSKEDPEFVAERILEVLRNGDKTQYQLFKILEESRGYSYGKVQKRVAGMIVEGQLYFKEEIVNGRGVKLLSINPLGTDMEEGGLDFTKVDSKKLEHATKIINVLNHLFNVAQDIHVGNLEKTITEQYALKIPNTMKDFTGTMDIGKVVMEEAANLTGSSFNFTGILGLRELLKTELRGLLKEDE